MIKRLFSKHHIFRSTRILMSTQSYKTTTKPAVVAFVTTPSTEVAKKIANVLLENKLCACVNIVPGITSLYTWKVKKYINLLIQ